MKKYLLTLLVSFCSIILVAQTAPNLFVNYAVTNGDSARSFTFANDKAWSMQIELKNPRGTLNGTFIIRESNDNADWGLYSSNSFFDLDSSLTVVNSDSIYNVRISGSDTIYTYRYADNYFDANYIQGYFIQNGLTGGTLDVIATFKRKE